MSTLAASVCMFVGLKALVDSLSIMSAAEAALTADVVIYSHSEISIETQTQHGPAPAAFDHGPSLTSSLPLTAAPSWELHERWLQRRPCLVKDAAE